jgi:hypothetical protein
MQLVGGSRYLYAMPRQLRCSRSLPSAPPFSRVYKVLYFHSSKCTNLPKRFRSSLCEQFSLLHHGRVESRVASFEPLSPPVFPKDAAKSSTPAAPHLS